MKGISTGLLPKIVNKRKTEANIQNQICERGLNMFDLR